MRMNLMLIALSLLILAAGIVCVAGMHKGLDAMMHEAEAACSLLPDDPEGALEALARLGKRWERAERVWQLFAIHEDLDNVSQALMQAQTALAGGNAKEAPSACTELLTALEEIHQKEVPTAGNVF